jgi:hypothetical protein
MISGSKQRFAIEAEVDAADLPSIWGRFRFWLCGRPVGDWEDRCALQASYNWLRDFAQLAVNRIEPSVANLDASEVFRLLVNPVLGPGGIADPRKQPIPFAYERFHITHLGMSSFDPYVMVLVKDANGSERCLWRKHGEDEIQECRFDPGEMESVAVEFCDAFEAQFLRTTH